MCVRAYCPTWWQACCYRPHVYRKEEHAAWVPSGRRATQCVVALRFATLLMLAALGAGCAGIATVPEKAASQPASSASLPIAVNISPATASVFLGASVTFVASASNTAAPGVNWSVNDVPSGNSTMGTISANGIFTAPQMLPSPATVTLQASSVADGTKVGSAIVTITSDLTVEISPSGSAVELGALQVFDASVTSAGQPNSAVMWTVSGLGCSGITCGFVSSAGVFTAPQILPAPGTVVLIATSVADPSKRSTVQVGLTSQFGFEVTGPPSVATSSVHTIGSTFTPVAGSNPSLVLAWSVSGAGCGGTTCGTIASGGGTNANYTAPATAPTPNLVTITATPLADASKARSISVTVSTGNTGVSISVSPVSATVTLGGSANFSGTVSGTAQTAVTWEVNGIAGGNLTIGTIVSTAGNTAQATYTAPASAPGTNQVLVGARSVADPSAVATAVVTLGGAPIVVLMTPAATTLAVNHRQTFTAQVLNTSDTRAIWSVNNVAGGDALVGQICVVNSDPCQPVTLAAAGSVDYIGPAAIPLVNPATLAVVSRADPTKRADSTITILPHVVVSVSPPSVALAPAASQTFTATVAGTADQQVIWNVAGAACSAAGAPCGTVDAAGRFGAPLVAPSPNSFRVVATSSEDSSRTASAAVTITSGPVIVAVLPASATAGSAGFTLRVQGGNFVATSPGPGSQIFIGAQARTTLCSSATDCTTQLAAGDLAVARNLSVTVQNPSGERSNTALFVIAAASGQPGNIQLTPSAPAVNGKDIIVVDLSTSGSASASQQASLNVIAIGIYQIANNSCTLAGGPVLLVRPAGGTAALDICAFSLSGLDPLFTYTISGPNPNDIAIVAEDALGFGIVHLTLLVPNTAQTGARTLFIQNANMDLTAATGAIEVQ